VARWRGAIRTVANNIVESATISDNIGVMDIFYRKATITTKAYDLKAVFKADKFTISQQAGFTKATGGTQGQYYIEPLLSFPSGTNADVGTTRYTYTGGSTAPGFNFVDRSVSTNPRAWTVGGPWWNGNVASNPATDREKYAQIDAEVPVQMGAIKKLRFGARYTDHTTAQNWYIISLTTLPFYTLANFDPGMTPGNFLDGLPGITADMKNHVIVNPTLLGQTVQGSAFGTTGKNMQQALDAGEGFQPAQSFQVDELTNAAYVQANFSQNNFTGNFGLRFVTTKTKSSGYTTSGTTVRPNSIDKDYTELLPSLNISYPLTNDLIARFGASQVIARPNYADLSSSVILYDSILQGVGGNPRLKPYKSTNLDLSFEWYFQKDAALAANLFYKDISDYILKSNSGESFFNEALGRVTSYNIARPVNAGGAKSKGFALSYQQRLPYGFGATANFTYVDAKSDKGDLLPFSSKNQLNLSPYWENKKLLLRLTYSWRSSYATSVDRGNYLYTDDYRQLDANAAYNITDNISLTLSCTNLLDETYYSYAKVPADMFQGHYKNGRRAQAGVHWNF
jgi:iron complex outermembrane recepter protein